MYCRSSSGSTIKDSGGEGQAQPLPKPKDKVIDLLVNVQTFSDEKNGKVKWSAQERGHNLNLFESLKVLFRLSVKEKFVVALVLPYFPSVTEAFAVRSNSDLRLKLEVI